MKIYLKLSLLVFLALFTSTLAKDNEAGEAAGILTSLLRESENSLKELDDYWKAQYPILKGVMDQIQGEFNALEQECFSRKDQISNSDQEIENAQHYIEWIGIKIQDNQDKIKKLEDAHCDTSKLYVNGLKHNKIAMELIAFLRKAIAEKDSLSLAQRKVIIGQLTVFFQMYAKNEIDGIMMLQQVDESQYQVDAANGERGRTEEDIGQQHVDDGREQIDVEEYESSQRRSWPEYKKQLLQLLDTLEAQIKEKMDKAQDEQVNSGVSLAEFKIQLESENQELDRHLNSEAERINRLTARKVREQAHYDQCIDEINLIFETLLQTRSEYEDKIYAQEQKRKAMQEEVDLFFYVHKMYTTKVNVDSTYQDREVDSFDILN